MKQTHSIQGNLVDIPNRRIYPARIDFSEGKINKITELTEPCTHYILPGFIDAHVHIESSMLVPTEFARIAVTHGTVATVSDPHEIANVMGVEGVRYMIENGKKSPFKFNFGAPSCVPATKFETAGAALTADDLDILLASPDIKYLAEMMNYPGVIYDDPQVTAILEVAKKHGKPIDGHAPGLTGEQALKYISKGISTDHECYQLEEARFKLQNGMKVIVREGSAAKNFDTLLPLTDEFFADMMFCSDDKHPDDLLLGHINLLVKRAVAKGNDVFKVLLMACINPVRHYGLEVGILREGDFADCIVVEDLTDFKVLATYIEGKKVAENGKSFIRTQPEKVINNFSIGKKKPSDFWVLFSGPVSTLSANRSPLVQSINIIEVLDGQLITRKKEGNIPLFFAPIGLPEQSGQVVQPRPVSTLSADRSYLGESSVEDDYLKIVVVNRYYSAPVAVAFIHNFGLQYGAIASSVAHDSHNIIAVGVDDKSICRAVNALIKNKGGLAATGGKKTRVLPLPVAGLMSIQKGEKTAAAYSALVSMAREMGSRLTSPFMSLSFMALLVIPSLKLSDKGLFDGEEFRFIPLEI